MENAADLKQNVLCCSFGLSLFFLAFSDVVVTIIFYQFEMDSRTALDVLKSEVHPKLLISQSKFSGPRKFTLRYR